VLASAPLGTEITVYNQGFALVKEARALTLSQGRQEVRIEDVAAKIEPTSVSIRNPKNPKAFQVLEQNYQFDLISPLAILNKSVGKKVSFTRTFGNQREVVTGVLLSSPTAVVGGTEGSTTTYNGLVIRTDEGKILLDPPGEITVLELPEGLISKPTLLWDLMAEAAGEQEVELSYLTQGISWRADYVLHLLPGDATANLQGWVTVDNQSGATYRDAKLKLLAGDVNRVRDKRPEIEIRTHFAYDAKAMDAGFAEESLFEYHLYTLQRPATVRDREIKQLSLLEAADLKVQKNLVVEFPSVGIGRPSEGTVSQKPAVEVEFLNVASNGLGIPMPKGIVKVYQSDASGSVQMLGEDSIDHTPKEEKVVLRIGQSFDIVAERKQTSYTRQGDRGGRASFEIQLRNRKDSPETVLVTESAPAQWRIVEESQPSKKLDAARFQYTVSLNANETKIIRYTLEILW
jgi:hypothetical protein